jgi:hypothetical protein
LEFIYGLALELNIEEELFIVVQATLAARLS